MAILARLDLTLGLFAQQYGHADTAARRRGVVAERELAISDGTLTRATGHQQLALAPGESRAVDIGTIDEPRLVYLESDRAILVRLGGADGDAIPVTPLSSNAPGLLLVTTAQPSAGVWLTNPGANVAIVAVLVAGLES